MRGAAGTDLLFKNLDEIAITEARANVLDLFISGIIAVSPETVLPSVLNYDKGGDILYLNGRPLDLRGKRVFVIGGGKAAAEMSKALEAILTPQRITAGLVTTKVASPTTKVDVVEAGHPIPDQRGISAMERMLHLKRRYHIDSNDIVICLISGGGSTLMPYPIEGMQLRDLQILTDVLISSGASINEMNVVRKHLSRIKGGRMGAYFRPAKVISLIISDVMGNDRGSIASGPTVPDRSTYRDAWDVLTRHGIVERMPEIVLQHLQEGMLGRTKETPRGLNNCQNHIIGDVSLALRGIYRAAREMGLRPKILTSTLGGDPADAANMFALNIAQGMYGGYDLLIAGAETTPTLPIKHGKGGRNQHFTAISLRALEGLGRPWCMASICTDGTDFLSDIGGALIDQDSIHLARKRRINVDKHIDLYDTYTLFKKMGSSLVEMGDTGTNVGDIVLYYFG